MVAVVPDSGLSPVNCIPNNSWIWDKAIRCSKTRSHAPCKYLELWNCLLSVTKYIASTRLKVSTKVNFQGRSFWNLHPETRPLRLLLPPMQPWNTMEMMHSFSSCPPTMPLVTTKLLPPVFRKPHRWRPPVISSPSESLRPHPKRDMAISVRVSPWENMALPSIVSLKNPVSKRPKPC